MYFIESSFRNGRPYDERGAPKSTLPVRSRIFFLARDDRTHLDRAAHAGGGNASRELDRGVEIVASETNGRRRNRHLGAITSSRIRTRRACAAFRRSV